MCDITCLPDEMLRKIFQSLDPRDLKAAVLVCPKWRIVGEATTFWTWAVVKIRTRDDFQKLNTERLGMLQEIEVACDCFSPRACTLHCTDETFSWDLFKVIFKIPTVRRIRGLIRCKSISKVDPDLLVSVINRLEELVLYWYMSTEQLDLLFRKMAENTQVKGLGVRGTHVRKVSPELFASAISNVAHVGLWGSRINSQQTEALLAVITRSQRPLRKLDVTGFGNIDPGTLGMAINRLEEVTIVSDVSVAQMTAILSILVYGESRLQKLRVMGMDPADVRGLDPDLVRRAKEKLGFFSLSW